MAARLLYAQVWKLSQTPSEEMVLQNIRVCIDMDKLTSILNDESNEMFLAKW